jgi:nitrogen-specific signal transduction histidine kinase
LQQVFTNLMLNGMQAMKEVDAARELTIKSERANNSRLLIPVSNTGVGFTPHQTDEIFNPFYSTKPNGIGMGAGQQPFHHRVTRRPLVGCRRLRSGRDFSLLYPTKLRCVNDCCGQFQSIHQLTC